MAYSFEQVLQIHSPSMVLAELDHMEDSISPTSVLRKI